jgi:integrase/recombinase XerD
MLLLDTGMRRGELVDLTMGRLHLQEGKAQITGKGNKDRVVFFGAQCKKLLWHYVTNYRPEPIGITTNVFLNYDGTALKANRMAKMLEMLGKRAGVEDVYPYRFRHTAGVEFIRNGGNVFALQKMLGHTTLEMVRYYVELAQEDVQRAHKTASPADNWQLA